MFYYRNPCQFSRSRAQCCIQVFVLGGSWSGPEDLAKDAEIYDPTLGTWTNLPGIQAAYILTDDPEDAEEGRVYRADNYGMFHSWSDGTGTFLQDEQSFKPFGDCVHLDMHSHACKCKPTFLLNMMLLYMPYSVRLAKMSSCISPRTHVIVEQLSFECLCVVLTRSMLCPNTKQCCCVSTAHAEHILSCKLLLMHMNITNDIWLAMQYSMRGRVSKCSGSRLTAQAQR